MQRSLRLKQSISASVQMVFRGTVRIQLFPAIEVVNL